jgi:hypothetical protein
MDAVSWVVRSTDQQGTRNDQFPSDGSSLIQKSTTRQMEIGSSLFLVDLLNRERRSPNFRDPIAFRTHHQDSILHDSLF